MSHSGKIKIKNNKNITLKSLVISHVHKGMEKQVLWYAAGRCASCLSYFGGQFWNIILQLFLIIIDNWHTNYLTFYTLFLHSILRYLNPLPLSQTLVFEWWLNHWSTGRLRALLNYYLQVLSFAGWQHSNRKRQTHCSSLVCGVLWISLHMKKLII